MLLNVVGSLNMTRLTFICYRMLYGDCTRLASRLYVTECCGVIEHDSPRVYMLLNVVGSLYMTRLTFICYRMLYGDCT